MRRAAPGFTLIEVLLAATLSLLLLAALMPLVGLTARDARAALESSQRREPRWVSAAVEGLRADLENARRMAVSPGVLRLLSFRSLDGESTRNGSLREEHDLVFISYVRLAGGWLVRWERRAGAQATGGDFIEIVAGGIRHFQVSDAEQEVLRSADGVANARRASGTRSDGGPLSRRRGGTRGALDLHADTFAELDSSPDEWQPMPDALLVWLEFTRDRDAASGRVSAMARRPGSPEVESTHVVTEHVIVLR